MKQRFDPLVEAPPPSSSGHSLSPTRPGVSGGWDPPEEGLVEQVLRILRRRKWIVLQAIVLIPLVAFLYSEHQPTQYTATAGLLFGDPTAGIVANSSTSATVDPTQVAATNSALAALPIVSTYAARQTSGRITASEIQAAVTVSSGSTGSNLTNIQAVSSSPRRAATIANAYGNGYIAFRKQADGAAIATSIGEVQANLNQLPPAVASGPQGQQLRGELSTLENAQALRTGGAVLVQPASPPHTPSSPKTTRNVILGVFVGIVLGIMLAALLDRLDQRISDGDDFERIYGLPVLAEIPRTRELAQGELPFYVAERFRALRTSLRYVNFDQRMRSLLVASPLPEDGKSTIARSLAETMAAMGDSVVLVDVDLHKVRAQDRGESGLSGVLIGDELEDALISEPLPLRPGDEPRRLTVLPAGPRPPNPSELVDSERMLEVLAELERRFDLVVLDAPALASVSAGLALIPVVSGILVVGAIGHTTIKGAIGLRQQIALLRGHPVGIVLNFTPRLRHGYGYGYG